MATLKHNANSKSPITGKYSNKKCVHGGLSHNAKKRRQWVQENKVFDGSLNEGEQFTLNTAT